MNFQYLKLPITNFKLRDNGFTLIEMIVAITVFVIMMLAITAFFVTLYKEQAADISKIEGISITSGALERVGNEIRKMNRAENGTFAIELADEQNFIFYSDIDNDGLTEKVEYFLNGTDLERRLTEPGISMDYSEAATATVVARCVRNGAEPVFAYYDENYTGSEDPLSYPANVTQVKLVGIHIDVNVNEKYPSSLVHAEVKINPRNSKNFD